MSDAPKISPAAQRPSRAGNQREGRREEGEGEEGRAGEGIENPTVVRAQSDAKPTLRRPQNGSPTVARAQPDAVRRSAKRIWDTGRKSDAEVRGATLPSGVGRPVPRGAPLGSSASKLSRLRVSGPPEHIRESRKSDEKSDAEVRGVTLPSGVGRPIPRRRGERRRRGARRRGRAHPTSLACKFAGQRRTFFKVESPGGKSDAPQLRGHGGDPVVGNPTLGYM